MAELTTQEFAKLLKEKYPAYKDIDDEKLVNAVIQKHPVYNNTINIKESSFSDIIPKGQQNNSAIDETNIKNKQQEQKIAKNIDGVVTKVPVYGQLIGIGNKLEDIGTSIIGKNTRVGEALDQGRPDRAFASIAMDFKAGRIGQGILGILSGGSSKFWQPLFGKK